MEDLGKVMLILTGFALFGPLVLLFAGAVDE